MRYSKTFVCILLIAGMYAANAAAQDVYSISGGEMIFQSGTIEDHNGTVNTNVRFTMWFHAGQYVHIDFGNNIGFYSGGVLRNIGFIGEEDSVKIKYRSYTLGIPLALKLGSFKDDFFVFGGAEYEWLFHFKQKTIINGDKSKYTDWFSDRTPSFLPSVFAGIHFPKGLQLTFKYYLDDFLNHNFKGDGPYDDYSIYTNTQLWYISLSWQVKNMHIKPPAARANMTANSWKNLR